MGSCCVCLSSKNHQQRDKDESKAEQKPQKPQQSQDRLGQSRQQMISKPKIHPQPDKKPNTLAERPKTKVPPGCIVVFFRDDSLVGYPNELNIKEQWYSIDQFVFKAEEKNKQHYLGSGTFSKVFWGFSQKEQNKQNKEVAIKLIFIDDKQILKIHQQSFLRQKMIESQGIVQIYMTKSIRLSQQETIFVVVFQFMEKGQLKIPKQGFKKHQQAFKNIKLLLHAYGTLFKRKIAHRNIKPQNILVSGKGEFKLSDFGTQFDKIDPVQNPEDSNIYQDGPYPSHISHIQTHGGQEKCDIYAIGCLFFQMLTGQTLKEAKCIQKTNKVNIMGVQNELKAKRVPIEMVTFIQGCLREQELQERQAGKGSRQRQKLTRFSWQQVYLHPLFEGSLVQIARQATGKQIIMNIRASAQNQQLELISELQNKFGKMSSNSKPQWVTKNDFINFFISKNIPVSHEDLQMLVRMYGQADKINLKALIQHAKSLNKDQFSHYSPEQCHSFLIKFHCTKVLTPQEKQYNSFVKQIKTNKYSQRQKIELKHVNFISFPLFPQMNRLKKIWIDESQIQVLEVILNAPQLEQLWITSSGVERVLTIQGCPNLTRLSLYGNKLRQMQGFQMIPKLKELYAGWNQLRRIKNIYHLKELRILELSDNKILAIEGLEGCPSITELYLKNNRINELSEHLLRLARSPAPLQQIHLYGNNIKGNQKNKDVLNKFKDIRLNSKLYLSGDMFNKRQQFQDAFQIGLLAEGDYKILCANMPSKAIEVYEDGRNRKIMQLTQANNWSAEQGWYLKRMQNNEYCILTNNKQQMLQYGLNGECLLVPYQEDKKEQNNWCRWVFIKEKKGSRAAFSIRLASCHIPIYSDREGKMEGCPHQNNEERIAEDASEGNHLWYVQLAGGSS